MQIKKNLILTGSAILIFLVGIMGGSFLSGQGMLMSRHDESLMKHNSGEMNNGEVKNNANDIKEITAKTDRDIKKLLAEGEYKCCLTKPCSYCLKESECDCLDNIMNGKHPCGECIGEILEGKGNPLLSEYFAAAIADEVGKKYTPALKQIIADKYGMPVEKQL